MLKLHASPTLQLFSTRRVGPISKATSYYAVTVGGQWAGEEIILHTITADKLTLPPNNLGMLPRPRF